MIGQSFAIIAVILIMSFMFLRSGRRAGALFALPLISVSVFHLAAFAAQGLFLQIGVPISRIHVSFDILGLLVGLWFCYKLSRAILIKRLRAVYFVSCAVFMAALAVAYISYHL